MSLNRVLFLAFTLILMFAIAGESSAQVRGQRGPIRKAGILTGLGWGNGNHWRNPGPNSSYYSPWTNHNATYFTRGYGNPNFGFDNGNSFNMQPGSAPVNSLPNQVIHSEMEVQPAAPADNSVQPPSESNQTPDVETPKPEKNDSVSGWKMDNSEFDENNLFERPVMEQPRYKPTVVDDSVDKKIQDLKENNFWNEK